MNGVVGLGENGFIRIYYKGSWINIYAGKPVDWYDGDYKFMGADYDLNYFTQKGSFWWNARGMGVGSQNEIVKIENFKQKCHFEW